MAPPAWSLSEDGDDPASAATAAARFTLANGWVGVRGLPDDVIVGGSAQPGSSQPGTAQPGPATLLAAVHDDEDHTYAEGGYAYPQTLERIVPVVDAWRLVCSVGVAGTGTDAASTDDPDALGAAHPRARERVLHLDRGVLDQTTRLTLGPTDAVVRSRRLVSFVRREVVAQRWEIRADDDGPESIDVVMTLAGDCHDGHDDSRAGARVVTESCRHEASGSRILQRTTRTGIGVAAVTRHLVDAGAAAERVSWSGAPDAPELHARLGPGQRLTFTVLVAHAAGQHPAETLEERALATLAAAEDVGWDTLVAEQARFLETVWRRGDVVIEGDDQMQLALRYGVFQTVQAAAAVQGVGVRAKGLSGPEYHGHTFWDSECFILPVLDHVLPEAAAAHLRWRHDTLPQARDRAREMGLAGASFPWRTITGRESSGYWPAGSAAYHVNADVAHAVVRHLWVTRDDAFAREVAVEILVETARLWADRGHHGADGFHLHGVTGPDEYTVVVDDNAYTNLMARRNLRSAVELTADHPDVAARLGVTDEERSAWARAADRMVVPRSAELGVTEQHAGFTALAPWRFGEQPGYPLADHAPFWEIYRHQVVKQADLVMALHLAGDDVDVEQKRRDFDYYEPMTVRDSSLSAPAQAVVAAEVGHGELAWAYARETALLDLDDHDDSTDQGLHIAALAGGWTALVAGFGGLRHGGPRVRLAPRLPRALGLLSFPVVVGTTHVRVEIRHDVARYELLDGDRLEMSHHGQPFELTAAAPVAEHPVPPWPDLTPPSQPPGRAPRA